MHEGVIDKDMISNVSMVVDLRNKHTIDVSITDKFDVKEKNVLSSTFLITKLWL